MSTRKKKTNADQLVRCFSVSEPTLHKNGYTIYKISQQIINVNQPDENIQELVVWRRYSDLRRLYKNMLHLHQALHRTQQFPPFAEAKVFGRYEESVLIERQRSGQDFLNFIAQRSYLVNSPAFQNFFQESVPVNIEQKETGLEPARNQETRDEQKFDVLQPVRSDGSGDNISVHSKNASEPVIDKSEPLVSSLGGVWCHQALDDINLLDDSDDDSHSADNKLTHTAQSQPTQDPDMSIFDPLGCHIETQDGASYSNAWLLSALTVAGSDSVKTESDVSLDNVDSALDPSEGMCSSFTGNSCGVQCGKGDLPSSPVLPSGDHPLKHLIQDSESSNVITSKSSNHESLASKKQSPRRALGNVVSNSRQSSDVVSSPKRAAASKDKGDYIIQANQHFGTAATCEENGDYYMAFNYYKQGIGILLTGVQRDEDERRRHIVRKKTARYLKKAEALHNQNLLDDDSRWHSSAQNSAAQSATCRGHVSELKNLQVLGVIQNVQLVMDKQTEKTYILKAIRKPSSEDVTEETMLPSSVPFMVELHRYYETDSAIYLLLQHATGGRLWTYVSSFLSQAPQCPLLDALFNDSHERQLRTANRSPCRLESTRLNDLTASNADRTSKKRNESHDSFSDCTTSYCALFSTSDANNGDVEVVDHTSQQQAGRNNDDANKRTSSNISSSSVERQISDGFQQMLKQEEACMELFSINSYENDDDDDSQLFTGAVLRIESPITDEQIDPESMQEHEQIITERTLDENGPLREKVLSAKCEREVSDDVFTDDPGGLLEHKDDDGGGTAAVIQPDKSDSGEAKQNDSRRNHVAPHSSQSHIIQHKSHVSRRRTLSSVFGDLDLAADGTGGTTSKHLPEACVCRWVAEVITAVSKLHAVHIYCRDLRPDNILLGPRGHVLLSYFYQLTSPREKPLNQFAVDHMYAAPELTGVYHSDNTCDWWSVGSLMYELLTGKSLASCHPSGFTSHTHLYIPEHVSPEAESLLRQLLKFDPSERLGGGDGGVDDIKAHPFFAQLNWNQLDT